MNDQIGLVPEELLLKLADYAYVLGGANDIISIIFSLNDTPVEAVVIPILWAGTQYLLRDNENQYNELRAKKYNNSLTPLLNQLKIALYSYFVSLNANSSVLNAIDAWRLSVTDKKLTKIIGKELTK